MIRFSDPISSGSEVEALKIYNLVTQSHTVSAERKNALEVLEKAVILNPFFPELHEAVVSTQSTGSIRREICMSSTLLSSTVRNMIRREYRVLDPKLPEFLDILAQHGADECWHKHGTFKDHLLGTWRILYLWGQPQPICRLALFHSAYSNDYVNLAIFSPQDRTFLKDLLGDEAEELVHKFCVVPRHSLIFHTLVPQGYIPREGLTVKNIKDSCELFLSREEIAIFLIVTMADLADQWFSWQDKMVGNWNGEMGEPPNFQDPCVLWPGDSLPGAWMGFVGRLGHVLLSSDLSGCQIVIPPIFNYLKNPISSGSEVEALKIYNLVTQSHTVSAERKNALEVLEKAVILNPFFPELHVYLAQIFIHERDWNRAICHVFFFLHAGGICPLTHILLSFFLTSGYLGGASLEIVPRMGCCHRQKNYVGILDCLVSCTG
eukprot:TRINITY_DN4607_c0_g1_i18.p1 TRINITY_DN4607_c0_g1~~TRINITY_DN4607_c0_g1_i18.p1  ORF type:complete len:434 (-),score=69.41 TRINITY_DN4607_c0_g1_i18:214-1515(-)